MRMFLLAGALFVSAHTHAQLDSLLSVLNMLPNDTSRLPVLTAILRYTVFSQPDSGSVFAEQYVALARKSGIPMEIGKGHNYTGMCYSERSEYDRALEHYVLALQQFEQGDDPWYTAMGHNNIASVLKEEGRVDEAEVEFRKALHAFAQIPDSVWIANVTNNLANVEHTQGNWDSAAVHYEAADRLLTDLEMFGFASQVRMNLANTYFDQGDPQKALRTMARPMPFIPKEKMK